MSKSAIENYTAYVSQDFDGSIMETVNNFIDFLNKVLAQIRRE